MYKTRKKKKRMQHIMAPGNHREKEPPFGYGLAGGGKWGQGWGEIGAGGHQYKPDGTRSPDTRGGKSGKRWGIKVTTQMGRWERHVNGAVSVHSVVQFDFRARKYFVGWYKPGVKRGGDKKRNERAERGGGHEHLLFDRKAKGKKLMGAESTGLTPFVQAGLSPGSASTSERWWRQKEEKELRGSERGQGRGETVAACRRKRSGSSIIQKKRRGVDNYRGE